MVDIFRVTLGGDYMRRNAGNGSSWTYISSDNGTCTNTSPTAYFHIVDDVGSRADIYAIAYQSSFLHIWPNGSQLTNMYIVAYDGFFIDDCAKAMLNVESVANLYRGGNK